MNVVKISRDSAGDAGSSVRRREHSPRPAWFGWSAILGLVLGGPAGAQPIGSAMPGDWLSAGFRGPPTAGITPSAWWDRRGLGVGLGGNVAVQFGRNDEPSLSASHRSAVLELAGCGGGASLPGTTGRAGALSVRLHAPGRAEGMWLAATGIHAEGTSGTLPLLGGGAWLQRGSFTFTTQIVQMLRTLRVTRYEAEVQPDTGRAIGVELGTPTLIAIDDYRLLTGIEAAMTWTRERWTLQSRASIAVGDHAPARWGELSAMYRTRRDLGVFARVRSAMDVPAALATVREPYAAVGMQLTVGGEGSPRRARPRAEVHPAVGLEPLGDSRYRITLAGDGRRVELWGDVTGWVPVECRKVSRHLWAAVLVMTPGVHRIAMRTDEGPWQAVAGLPVTQDEFGGEVGLLVVE